jgi:hypothetical protein
MDDALFCWTTGCCRPVARPIKVLGRTSGREVAAFRASTSSKSTLADDMSLSPEMSNDEDGIRQIPTRAFSKEVSEQSSFTTHIIRTDSFLINLFGPSPLVRKKVLRHKKALNDSNYPFH